MRHVYITIDDIDWHGVLCPCGLCNHAGKSYGAAIYAAGRRRVLIERLYARTEQSAEDQAHAYAQEQGWYVVGSPAR
jgi:hypothetical protein